MQGKTKLEEILTHDETSNDRKDKKRTKKEGKDRSKGDKVKSRKKPAGPMHFTANNEPRALEVLGDLDPSVFEEVCFILLNIFNSFNSTQIINHKPSFCSVRKK